MSQAVISLNKLSLDSGENSNLSTSSETDTSSDEDDSLLYHMEKKYLEHQEIDSSINIVSFNTLKKIKNSQTCFSLFYFLLSAIFLIFWMRVFVILDEFLFGSVTFYSYIFCIQNTLV